MRRRFFVEHFREGRAFLRGEAAHHLGRVLRAEPGQLCELSDGYTVWLGRIEQASKDAVEFALVEKVPVKLPSFQVTLLLALVKFDRLEWCLEKATELGVAEIVPLAAARSEKRLLEAAPKRAERWRKILLEAAQQSRRLRPPELGPLIRPAEAFVAAGKPAAVIGRFTAAGGQPAEPLKLLFSEQSEAPPLREFLAGKQAARAVVAVGPEGGWVDAELAAAGAAGFREASLGPLILRTETAVIAALAQLNYALGDQADLH